MTPDVEPVAAAREQERLAALHGFAIVDTPPEAIFDSIATIAARICNTPIAMVTFIDRDHQSIKARVGIDIVSTPRDESFCTHVLDRSAPMVVEDTTVDARFAGIPLVTERPRIRFYAGAPIRTEEGHGLGAVCVLDTDPRHLEPFQLAALEALADDVSARLEARRAVTALTESERLHRQLFATNPQPMWLFDPVTLRFLDVNETAAAAYGWSREEFRQMTVRDLWLPEDIAEKDARIGAGIPARTTPTFTRHRRKDGSVIAVEGEAREFFVEGRRTMLTLVTDVTGRHEAEARLREQAALIDAARDAIMVRDMQNTIISWNGGAERIFGWSAEEAIGRNAVELLHRDSAAFERATAQLLATGHWSGEIRKMTRSGGDVIVEGGWTLLRHDDGRPRAVLIINTDVTEKRKLEAQYLRAQRMESIGTLAGGIAHDLNNMLSPILMSIELLRLSATDPSAIESLNTIETSARRGASLVKQVLTFARGVEGQREHLAVHEIIADIAKLVRDTFPRAINVVTNVVPDLDLVIGDWTQIHQVLLNLVVNARDAMPAGGKLELSATNVELDAQYAAMTPEAKAARYVVIQVSDNGSGIPEAVRDRIFEPFFTTKSVGEGTGLGLATVQAIVRSHGGFITVYSEIGSGTTFKAYFPALDAQAGPASAVRPEPLPRGHGETILVVDDEAAIRDISRQTLETFGYVVLTATDGADGLATFARRNGTVDAIITDIMMPVMDGPAFIHAVRRLDPDVPIIAASGLTANGSHAGPAFGVRHFLPKPYTADTMLRALRDALENR